MEQKKEKRLKKWLKNLVGDLVDPEKLGQGNKPIKMHQIKLSSQFDHFHLIPISDLHVGDPQFNPIKLLAYEEWIMSKENAFVVLNGDLVDAAIKNSIGDVYGNAFIPGMQIKLVHKLLEPIKDRILAVVSGNHEDRIFRETGIDISEWIADKLGTWYGGDEAWLEIHAGKGKNGKPIVYTVYMTHGWGAGRTPGAKTNNLSKMKEISLADVIIASHTHFMTTHHEPVRIPDIRTGFVREDKIVFVSSGAYVGRPTYAVRKGIPPAKQGSPNIWFDGRRKDVHSSI